ncbi:MAG: hypothetical protein ACLU99_05455 [Alphaproteobacteria bacterium]
MPSPDRELFPGRISGQKAEDELARARLTDSQQATPRRFEDFTLVEIRR